MINNFSKIFLYITIGFLLVWQLPWCYNFFVVKPSASNFTLYSTVVDDFVSIGFEKDKIVRSSVSGEIFTELQYDSILPMFYYRQLITDGNFPEEINGIKLTPKEIQYENFNFRSVPSTINMPKIGLYSLMESMSKRVALAMPDDVFRLTDSGVEFVDMDSNTIKKEKSEVFTNALKEKGFVFPIKEISGNPTTKKEYDNGYVILDANGNLFHFKMTVGRPYVRAVELPENITLEHLFITEFINRKTLAFMTDSNNKFYVLTPEYKVHKVGIPSFNPKINSFTIMGNLFDWTIRVTSSTEDNYYAVDGNDYSLIKDYKITLPSGGELPALSFTSAYDRFVKPRF